MIFAPYDTETTGLPFHQDAFIEQQPKIIEFAGLLTDGKQVLDQFEFICNPHQPLEAIITKITGLTDEILKDKEDFGVYVDALRRYFERADVVIAHNLSFDKSMLRYDLERRGLSLADISWPKIEICTVEQTMFAYGRRMKMEELYNMLCGEYVQKHRALDDVLLLNELCETLGVYDVFSAA